MKYDAISID